MSSVSVRLDDETDQLLQRLKDMSDIDKAGMMNAIAEGLRTSTLERFRTEESPDGKKWKRSIRAEKSGGKTLTKTRATQHIHSCTIRQFWSCRRYQPYLCSYAPVW